MKRSLCLLILTTIFFGCAVLADFRPQPGDIVNPPGLPQVGKWMITPDLVPAHWLNQKYRGKGLREPINIILIDNRSKNIEEAKQNLMTSCAAAGYKARFGHSTGYKGYIAGALYEQLPQGKKLAFSNGPFEFNNNHGRIFGPCTQGKTTYFIGAFSREVVDLKKPKEIHQFGSFNQARDDFAWKMDQKTGFKVVDFVDLDNFIVDDPNVSTGDHDGIAAVLKN